MKLVGFVASPLQALNLAEYGERTDQPIDTVVVCEFSGLEPASRTQIEAVLSAVGPRQIIYRRWMLSPRTPIGARRAVLSAVASLRQHLSAGPYEFVVGEYRSTFSWAVLRQLKVPARKIVVVDDGTAMLRIDRRRRLVPPREQWLHKVRNLLFAAVGVRAGVPSHGLTFFTTYALEDQVAKGDAVVRNDYRNLSAELRGLPPDDDSVYVIGGPHGEAMPEELDSSETEKADVELALDLARFAAEYTGKDVVYMAHRREGAKKLETLGKEVKVVVPNVPFEIYPRVLGRRPTTIVGYYSSLFVSAVELLGDSVEIIALEIPREFVNETWRAFVDDVYRYYRDELTSSIRVVDQSRRSQARPPSTGYPRDSAG